MNAELSILDTTRDLLTSGGKLIDYETNLLQLGKLVSLTGTNEKIRDALVHESSFLKLSSDTLNVIFQFKFQSSAEEELYIRNVRGLILIVRNLCASTLSSPSSDLDLSHVISSMEKFTSTVNPTTPYFAASLLAYLQLLANHLTTKSSLSNSEILMVLRGLKPTIINDINSPDSKSPLHIILSILFQRKLNLGSEWENQKYDYLIDYIIRQSCLQMSSPRFTHEILPLLQGLFTQDFIGPWLINQQKIDNFEQVLNLCQLVVTSKEEWPKDDIINFTQWASILFRTFADKSIALLNASEFEDKCLITVHANLVRSLDILTDLCKYDEALQSLRNQENIALFIKLFRAVHEKTETVTQKTRKRTDDLTESDSNRKKKFPMVKSLLIEILTFMCCESHSIQEQIRELHGLELVLSSCVIDESNPFIKEHAILCLKFLLHNNPKNKEFVALLEAKKVVNSEALADAGFELSIKNGNVEVKNNRQ